MAFSPGQKKQIVLAALIGVSLLLELIFQIYLGVNVVYSHFFYIPIVLAAIWYGKRAVFLAIFFGLIHIAGVIYETGVITTDALLRALMFVIVALVVGIVADMMRKEQNALVEDVADAALRARPAFRGNLGDIRDRILSTVNIARMKEEKDVPGLIRALRNPDISVQYEATEALGQLRDPAAVQPLMGVLTDDQYSGIRWKAAEALVQIGTPAVDPLIAVLSHPEDDVRWKAAIALGEIGDNRAIGPLIELLRDEDRFVKGRAAYALGLIGSPAVAGLIRALREGDGNLRWGAAIALGNIRDAQSIFPLLHALGDRYENVRSEAASALVAIGSPVVIAAPEFLRGAGEPETLETIGVLGEIGTRDAVLVLEGLRSHPLPGVRDRAAAELAELAGTPH
ncbi:MAG: HEAT repeat domain-containing protein [Methanoregulaceae archaeon]|nr:HEAT repeat domain-containing protein [Methanoregulaceae archaeon]